MSEIVPQYIAAGVNFSASAWLSQFSGAEWTLTLMLRGPAAIDLAADRDGSRHVWDVAAGTTSAWAPGQYVYTVRASNDTGDAYDVEQGTRTIRPDLAAAVAGYDGRSQARIALEAIDAVLAKRATMDQERYRINNRELYRTSITELLRLRGYYAERVSEEDRKARGLSRFGRQVKIVMGLGR